MKKITLLSLTLMLLSACSGTQSSSTSFSSPSQEDVPYYESTSSYLSTSEQSSSESISYSNSSDSQSSSSKVEESITIKKIKEIAKAYVGKENSVGVYESNYNVEIKLTLLACLDAITSKTGYGDRYKILMTDGEDYIYLKTSLENYKYLKDYVSNQGEYLVKGHISLYNNEVELTVNDKPTYLNKDNKGNINFDNFSSSSSLEEIYKDIDNLKLNCKGVAFSKIVKLPVKCLAKDINNTNLYFANKDYIINVHGDDKVTNKFTKDKDYILYGALSMHNFRPSLEYVHHISLTDEEVDVDFSNLETKTNEFFYKNTFEVDKLEKYPSYTEMFKHPCIVEGYLNFYLKNDKYYTVIESNLKEDVYSTYVTARSAKTLMLVNENLVNINNLSYFPYVEEYETGTKVKAIIFPYLWNSNDYPQVYLYQI